MTYLESTCVGNTYHQQTWPYLCFCFWCPKLGEQKWRGWTGLHMSSLVVFFPKDGDVQSRKRLLHAKKNEQLPKAGSLDKRSPKRELISGLETGVFLCVLFTFYLRHPNTWWGGVVWPETRIIPQTRKACRYLDVLGCCLHIVFTDRCRLDHHTLGCILEVHRPPFKECWLLFWMMINPYLKMAVHKPTELHRSHLLLFLGPW